MKEKEFKLSLDELLQKELEELRKRFRPYKRRPFLRNKVKIEIAKTDDDEVNGYYENTKKDEKQMQYTHQIFITENHIDSYKRWLSWNMKRFGMFNLRQVIRHELIHAFVFEEWEEWGDIKNMHGDYSPIFLSCLYWGGGTSGHPHVVKFLKTDLGEQIQHCKVYDDLFLILTRYIIGLERTTRDINKDLNKNLKDYKELNIEFNVKGAGIVKRQYISVATRTKENNKLCRQKTSEMTLGLGFLATSKELLENYKRKFDNGALAKAHIEMAAYMVNNELRCKTILEKI